MSGAALTEGDVDELADGCAILGSGGGGESHTFRWVLREMLAARGPVRVLDPAQLAPAARVVNVGFVGAPVVMTEKLLSERAISTALEGAARRLGTLDALMAAEIGGANGLSAFIAASLLGIPVVDADGMGRAFPMSDQISYSIYGKSASPTIAATEHGEVVFVEGGDNRRIEQIVRAVSTANGSMCFTVDYPLTGDEVRTCAIPGSVSRARRIGAALRAAREAHRDPAEALTALLRAEDIEARVLFEGKVVDCRHETRGGWGLGVVTVSGVGGGRLEIAFQNEFLLAQLDGRMLATTPDIISIVDADTLENIGSDRVRYGQRVRILGIESPRLMATPEALAIVGPRAFGFDVDYAPLRRPA
jgi:DUF917 family protein